MTNQRPTLIFVHGAFHTAEYWNPVKNTLEKKGYRCLAPNLMYNGTGIPIKSNAPAVAELQDIVVAELDLGNDVVMVNHSFGGVAGCSAIKGLTRKDPSSLRSEKSGHVVGIAQIAAFAPPTGIAMGDHVASIISRHPEIEPSRMQMRFSDDGWAWFQGNPILTFYNDLPPEEAQRWADKLIGFTAIGRVSNDGIYAGWQDVPVWYLQCKLDQVLRPSLQSQIVQECRDAGAKLTSREVEASHSPMLSRPEEVAAFIEDAVASFANSNGRSNCENGVE